jgi:hypothetical protein
MPSQFLAPESRALITCFTLSPQVNLAFYLLSTMKFSASVINQLRLAPSVQGRIRPSHEFVNLAEETATGSPLDHWNGTPPFQQA